MANEGALDTHFNQNDDIVQANVEEYRREEGTPRSLISGNETEAIDASGVDEKETKSKVTINIHYECTTKKPLNRYFSHI